MRKTLAGLAISFLIEQHGEQVEQSDESTLRLGFSHSFSLYHLAVIGVALYPARARDPTRSSAPVCPRLGRICSTLISSIWLLVSAVRFGAYSTTEKNSKEEREQQGARQVAQKALLRRFGEQPLVSGPPAFYQGR